MNYRHSYHAGNFADVFKHSILILLIKALLAKDKPFCYLDTHAGMGRYKLTSRTREFVNGIERLRQQENVFPLLEDYLQLAEKYHYPGSPRIARALLRPQDRMLLNELNEQVYAILQHEFQHDEQTTLYNQDAYQCLKALLPPLERRGLIFIDPPFENPNEFINIIAGLKEGLHRFATGIYAVWYPIKARHSLQNFYRQLADLAVNKILLAELTIYPDDTAQLGLNGCGMIIVNPPWKLIDQLKQLLPYLWRVLSINQQGDTYVKWLKYEE